jgi:hypothetical protein
MVALISNLVTVLGNERALVGLSNNQDFVYASAARDIPDLGL